MRTQTRLINIFLGCIRSIILLRGRRMLVFSTRMRNMNWSQSNLRKIWSKHIGSIGSSGHSPMRERNCMKTVSPISSQWEIWHSNWGWRSDVVSFCLCRNPCLPIKQGFFIYRRILVEICIAFSSPNEYLSCLTAGILTRRTAVLRHLKNPNKMSFWAAQRRRISFFFSSWLHRFFAEFIPLKAGLRMIIEK